MICFDYFIVAILGLSFGSFANVCINRLPSDFNIISPSRCQFCKTPIKYLDNVPVFSYLLLKGVSRCCNKMISLQYPIVEFLVMIFALLSYYFLGRSLDTFLLFIFVLSLIIIFVTDYKEFIIPNLITYFMMILGIIFSFLHLNPVNILIIDSLLGGFISGLIFFSISKIFLLVRKKEGLGMGDVKMIAMIGFWLGLELTLMVIVLSSILGIIFSLTLVSLKRMNFSQYIPYGCFISISTAFITYLNLALSYSIFYLFN